jgi:hypothetical protein
MARIATGVSKKSNRENLAALTLVLEWRKYGLVEGFLMTPEVAWALSGTKFGNKPKVISDMPLAYEPEGEPSVDAIKVAKYVIKMEGGVA